MKLRNFYLPVLSCLATAIGLTSCSDDDYDPYEGGSLVAMPEYRGFILNEGSYGSNDASISFFDAAEDTTTSAYNDIFYIQNGVKLGDTGQSLIVYDNSLFVAVYGSSYVAKLNKSGVLQVETDFSSYGQPRYMAAEDDYLYVTTYGGYVVKLSTSDLSYIDKVEVGAAPERIIEEDGKLYVALGYTTDLATTDNRMAIIDVESFEVEQYVEVMENAQNVVGDGNYIFIQGYGTDWVNTPVYVYNVSTGEAKNIGYNASFMVEEDNVLYAVYSETDWTTYETSNTFFSYDPSTETYTDLTSQVVSQASELASAGIYSMSVNPYDDSFYITTTDYYSYGTVYHFCCEWNYKSSFSTWGVNANSVVVIR